jgi:hypothetical protein
VALPDPVIHLYWALCAGQGQGDVQADAVPDRGLRRASRTRVRDPGPEENHLPVLQRASQGEERERAGEMSRSLCALRLCPGLREPGNYQWYLFGFSFEIRQWSAPIASLDCRRFSGLNTRTFLPSAPSCSIQSLARSSAMSIISSASH